MQYLINKIKAENQDFEFYPSTPEMMRVISRDIKRNYDSGLKVLDVGCGNGNALRLIQKNMDNKEGDRHNINIKMFGMEKSKILIQNLEKDIIIIGNDFHQNVLIDKQMDCVFCNPPYSEFNTWAYKLITEVKATDLYLIIPQRWKKSNSIQHALKMRFKDPEGKVKILGSFDFTDSEYRKARAKVDILKISFARSDKDPFDIWFDQNFDIKTDTEVEPEEKEKQAQQQNELMEGKNLVERIEHFYMNEKNNLLRNYKNLENIDTSLLDELGVDLKSLKEGLKEKISSLKNKYWKEIFNNLDKITDRLTKFYRERLLEKLTSQTGIDINCDNMYSVAIWVIKNANIYQDEQLKAVYKEMTEPKNVTLYKSNTHFVTDKWRYADKQTHYKLEYRLVMPCGCGENEWSFRSHQGMNERGYFFISDIFTIAKTLGFKLKNCGLSSVQWSMGELVKIYDDNGDIFAELRPYKNGNLHAKFSKEFIKTLNVEAGRLNGWVKDPANVEKEMDLSKDEAFKYFNSIISLNSKQLFLLQ